LVVLQSLLAVVFINSVGVQEILSGAALPKTSRRQLAG
jgi:hypothetical protein